MTVGSRKGQHSSAPSQFSALPGGGGHQGHHSGSGGGGVGSAMDATFIWKLAKLGRVGSSHLRYDDDWVDRLNYQITCFLHFLFIGVLGIRSYIGKPIQCWAPQEFNKAWEEYSENFCWVSNTFYAPINNNLPLRINRSSKMIGYYQWTPIVLACQALLFYLPCLVWRLLQRYSGFNVRRIIQMASDTNAMVVPEISVKNVRFIARYIDTCIERNYRGCQRRHLNQVISLDSNNNNGNNGGTGNNGNNGGVESLGHKLCRGRLLRTCCCCCGGGSSLHHHHHPHHHGGKRSGGGCCCWHTNNGRFLFSLYLLTKLCYLGNIFFQLYLMKRFLGTDSSFFGIKVLLDLVNGLEWNQSGNFPRVTFCEVQTKKLGENNVYNLQCVLPLNMFLEKIYIFLWFYYVALGALTAASLMGWLARMGGPRQRCRLVRRYLRLLRRVGAGLHRGDPADQGDSAAAAAADTDGTAMMAFSEAHLRPDGVFLLQLVTANVGHVVAGDVTAELWNIYRYRRSSCWRDPVIDNIRYLDSDYLGSAPPSRHHHGHQGHQTRGGSGSGPPTMAGSLHKYQQPPPSSAVALKNDTGINGGNSNHDDIV